VGAFLFIEINSALTYAEPFTVSSISVIFISTKSEFRTKQAHQFPPDGFFVDHIN